MLDLTTQIRHYTEHVDATVPTIDDLLADLVEDAPPGEPSPRRLPRWAVAVAAVAIVIAAVGGLAALVGWLRAQDDVVDQPPETVIEQLNALTIADLPSFQATIAYEIPSDYFETPPSAGDTQTGVVELTYAAEGQMLRLQMVEDAMADADADSYFIWDGTYSAALFSGEEEGRTFLKFETEEPSYPPSWAVNWKDRCGADNIEVLVPEDVAGRSTIHILCTTIRAQWELWIDDATGLALRATGPYFLGTDVAFTTGEAQGGGFEVTEITYGITPDPVLFDTAQPPDVVVQPLEGEAVEGGFVFDSSTEFGIEAHLVISETTSAALLGAEAGEAVAEDLEVVTDIWYSTRELWRTEVLSVAGPGEFRGEVPGNLVIQGDGINTSYFADTNAYWTSEEEPWMPFQLEPLLAGAVFATEPGCATIEDGTFLQRPARFVDCVIEMDPEEAAMLGVDPTATVGYVVDTETGIVLRETSPWRVTEVLTFEVDPVLPADIYTFVPPEDAHNLNEAPLLGPLRGDPAPALSGILADGTSFDLASLRGERVAVLFSATWMVDAVEDYQAAADVFGDGVTFVFVAVGESEDLDGLIDRGGLTYALLPDPDLVHWEAWQVPGWPWLGLVDKDGIVVEVIGYDRIGDDLIGVFTQAGW